MHKKIEIIDLDIPKDDLECWDRYPKYRWAYDKSRLFDAQGIKWSPFPMDDLRDSTAIICLDSKNIEIDAGKIYYNKPTEPSIISELYIAKGEIKYIQYFDGKTGRTLEQITGDIEIRIIAFVSMHFQKFTGVVSVEIIGTGIYEIHLHPINSDFALNANNDIIKIVKRIYKRNEAIVVGPTDQAFHEILTA